MYTKTKTFQEWTDDYVRDNIHKLKAPMTQFVVYQVEFGGDVDGTGPERWLGMELGRFNTEAEALDFVDNHYEICEVVQE
jgi:hypothetical protein